MRVEGEAAARLRAQARRHVCTKMSHKPEQRPSQLPAAEVASPPRAVRGYGGLGPVGVRVEVARLQADTAPQPPSPTSSATSAEVMSPSSPESPRRSGGKGLGRKGSRGEKKPRQGQGREETAEVRQRRVEAGHRWWQRKLRGRERGRGSER